MLRKDVFLLLQADVRIIQSEAQKYTYKNTYYLYL